MRRTAAAILLAAGLALAGCSSNDTSDRAAKNARPKAEASTKPGKLEPVWGPKLDAAKGKDAESTSACMQPSSNACARYIKDIMGVVSGVEGAIKKTGRQYPASMKQIREMKAAQAEYLRNGCQGDVTAEDPDSLCHGVVTITVGATTLDITLSTDEVGM
jgi:hypothetical protein